MKQLLIVSAALLLGFGCKSKKETSNMNKSPETEQPAVKSNPLQGKWNVVSIKDLDDKSVKEVAPYISISEEKLSGHDGCNRIFTSFTLNENSIKLKAIAQTKIACNDPKENRISNAFTSGLGKTTHYKIEQSKLSFLNEKGEVILTFLKV